MNEALLSASRRTNTHTRAHNNNTTRRKSLSLLTFSLLLSTINRLISISSTRSNPPSSCTEDIWTLSSALESTPVCTDRNTRVHTLSPSAFRSRPDISRTWAFSSVAVLSAREKDSARFAEHLLDCYSSPSSSFARKAASPSDSHSLHSRLRYSFSSS